MLWTKASRPIAISEPSPVDRAPGSVLRAASGAASGMSAV